MDGVSGLGSMPGLAQLSSEETAGAVQIKVMKEAMDQASTSVLQLLEGLGQNVDVTA